MPWFYFRPFKFFPKEEPVRYHRVLWILPVPFEVQDKGTALAVNLIVLGVLIGGALLTALIVIGLLGVDLPFELILPYDV